MATPLGRSCHRALTRSRLPIHRQINNQALRMSVLCHETAFAGVAMDRPIHVRIMPRNRFRRSGHGSSDPSLELSDTEPLWEVSIWEVSNRPTTSDWRTHLG